MSMPVVAWTFPAGKLVQDVQSLALVNATVKTLQLAPPLGKRWLLTNVKAANPDDVARQISIEKFQDAAKTILVKTLASEARNALTILNWPNNQAAVATDPVGNKPEILESPNVLLCTWASGGASAGGTDADGFVVEYLEMDTK